MAVTIVTRVLSDGSKTHRVKWRNGRASKEVTLGQYSEKSYGKSALKFAKDRKAEADAMIRKDGAPSRVLLDQRKAAHNGTFADVAAVWMNNQRHVKPGTVASRQGHVKMFNQAWGGLPATSITQQQVQDWINKLQDADPPKKGSTVALYLATLRPLLREGAGLDHDWLKGVNKSGVVKVHFGEDEDLDLPDKARRDGARCHLCVEHQAIFDLMEHGGLRLAEAVNLLWGQVDNEFDQLVRVGTKGIRHNSRKRPRIVERLEFQPSWVPGSEGHPVQRPANALPTDRVFPDERADGDNFRVRMYESSDLSRTERFQPKSLRHLHASQMNRWSRGKSARHDLGVYEMAERMGHSQMLFLTTYAHATPTD